MGKINNDRPQHIFCLRGAGNKIFGTTGDFFDSGYNRATVAEFQTLLGVKDTIKGKRYVFLPPILYPEGSGMDPKQLFLNPALPKVSVRF